MQQSFGIIIKGGKYSCELLALHIILSILLVTRMIAGLLPPRDSQGETVV